MYLDNKNPKIQRLEHSIFERENYTCQTCKDNNSKVYLFGNPNYKGSYLEYDNDKLFCLCCDCIEIVEKEFKSGRLKKFDNLENLKIVKRFGYETKLFLIKSKDLYFIKYLTLKEKDPFNPNPNSIEIINKIEISINSLLKPLTELINEKN